MYACDVLHNGWQVDGAGLVVLYEAWAVDKIGFLKFVKVQKKRIQSPLLDSNSSASDFVSVVNSHFTDAAERARLLP